MTTLNKKQMKKYKKAKKTSLEVGTYSLTHNPKFTIKTGKKRTLFKIICLLKILLISLQVFLCKYLFDEYSAFQVRFSGPHTKQIGR